MNGKVGRLFLIVALTGAGCRVELGDDKRYSCSSDADCDGDGYRCVTSSPDVLGECCKPSAQRSCRAPTPDAGCGAKLTTDPANCGACGLACNPGQKCAAGECLPSTETSCADGIDNDQNGLTDCADPSCEGRACGGGCTCVGGAKRENDCTDGLDNDGDGQIDCEDSDCDGALCGAGCVCGGGARHEADCADGIDNDRDGESDCADADCSGVACHPAPATFVCSAAGTCACNGGPPAPEDGGEACRNGIDDDCNGATDCADQGCDLASCNPDGGPGCVCAGHKATEVDCSDLIDNDADGLIDCADFVDCPAPVNCTALVDGGTHLGSCGPDHLCH